MSEIEQKILSLFSPLPFSIKAKILATLSQLLANEAIEAENQFLEEDLEISKKVRNIVSEGKMELICEEEYWSKWK